ncbi:MAG: type II secretion system F family protein [Candidatus Micrarchaeota archaeon]|nr:type II secretion system F family protein [Candidatus Micrarchaeota archaeon]
MIYSIGEMAPHSVKRHIEEMLRHAGLRMDARAWIGSAVITSLVLSLLTYLALVVASVTDPFITHLVPFLMFFSIVSLFYIILYFQIEGRRELVERVLPDLLQITASNIKAGVSPVIALRMASRPEFGPLHEEIRYVTAKSLGTESITEALKEISKRIRSSALERTISLFATSLRSGGSVSQILESSAEDIRENQEMRRELISGTNMYVVFILFTVIVGMPILLAVSMQFIEMTAKLSAPNSLLATQIGISMSAPISAQFIFNMSVLILVVTSLISSMLIGVIHHGRELVGLRYLPMILIGSLVFFYVAKNYILTFLLGGFVA